MEIRDHLSAISKALYIQEILIANLIKFVESLGYVRIKIFIHGPDEDVNFKSYNLEFMFKKEMAEKLPWRSFSTETILGWELENFVENEDYIRLSK